MNKTIWKFGVISGVVSSVLIAVTVPFLDRMGHGSFSYLWGYTSMVAAFLMVYFGIRSYRDSVGGGRITFGKAFAIGISITLISCVFYVVTWEIVYFNFMPGFMDSYAASAVDKLRASGANAAAIQAKIAEMDKLKAMYRNPLFNAARTFIEPFPVGLVITLVSAAILRKKTPAAESRSDIATA